jgi:hypothetical protein
MSFPTLRDDSRDNASPGHDATGFKKFWRRAVVEALKNKIGETPTTDAKGSITEPWEAISETSARNENWRDLGAGGVARRIANIAELTSVHKAFGPKFIAMAIEATTAKKGGASNATPRSPRETESR